MTNQQMSLRNWALLVTLAMIWGWSYLFQKFALAELPVVIVLLGRVGLATITLFAVMQITGRNLPRERSVWVVFLIMSLLNNIFPFGLILSGQLWVNSGLTAILIGATPLFSVFLAPLILGDERLTTARVVGVLLGIAGLVVLIGPSALAGQVDETFGQLLILCGALSYALAAIVGRRIMRGIEPITMATGQLLCATLIMVPVVAITDQPWHYDPSWTAWLGLFGIAVPCTALGYIIYFRLLVTSGATNLLLVTLLVPVSAVIVGALVANEVLTWSMLGGGVLILFGLAVIDGRLFRKRKPASQSAQD